MKASISRRIHYLLGPIIGLSGPGVWDRTKEEKWQNFCSELFKVFGSKDMIDKSIRIVHTDLSYVIEISFREYKEEEVKAILQEIAQRHKVEIEFEEEKKKKEKWRPVHEIVIERLKKWPVPELSTIAGIYKDGAKIPSKHIPALLDALGYALNRPGVDTWTEEITKQAIQNLKEQQKEG